MSAMSPAEEIFFAALARLTPADQAAYLDEACHGQPELRRRVEKLLEVHPRAAQFLKSEPALKSTESYAAQKAAGSERPSASAGTIVAGKYKLLQQIGEGGMGSVWMADQTEPVRRRVAVKLIRVERSHSKTVLSRFEAERQAIALMDHPNIAKLLDAGATEAGEPYFVMELVKGIPLTDYCDAHKMDIPTRLQLFMQICSAVQHAHQKGIIHRDLKPTNILVENHDDKPVPKVIDFGLAKATSDMQLTEHTLFTAFGNVMGTPLYMAPEQAKFNAVDIDTRADIYSLGVILYELLTGTTPIARDTLKKAALDEMLKLVREEEAPTPSSRLSSAGSSPKVAANRQSEPSKLGRFVKGELDWIVLKALNKERDRRYETATGFARDVERFLNDEPVTAGPPSAAYKLRKFVRRNRGQVIAAALILFALLAGIGGTTIGLIRANRFAEAEGLAKVEAQDEKEKAESAAASEKAAKEQAQIRLKQIEKGNGVLTSIFDDLDVRKVREGTEPLEAVLAKRLVKAAEQLEGEAVGDALAVAALQNKLGETLLQLGYTKEAIRLFEKAGKTRTAQLGSDHPDTLVSLHNLVDGNIYARKLELAIPLNEETVKLRKAKLGPDHIDTLKSMNNLAYCYQKVGKVEKAIELNKETLERQKATLGPDHSDTLDSMENLAECYKDFGNIDLALSIYEDAWKVRKVKLPTDHPDRIVCMNSLARFYDAAGKRDLALPLYEESVRLSKARLGADHPHTLVTMANLGSGYREAGKLDLAISLLEETLKLQKAKLGADHPDTLHSMHNLAVAFQESGKLDLALSLYEETVRLANGTLGAEDRDTLRYREGLAICYQLLGKLDLALPLLEETLMRQKSTLGANHPDTMNCMINLASVYKRLRKFDLAFPLFEEILELQKVNLGIDHPTTLQMMNGLAEIYRTSNKVDLALPLLIETLRLREAKLGSDHVDTLQSMNNLAMGYWSANQWDQSIPLLEKTLRLKEAKLGRQHVDTLITMTNLGTNYRDTGRLSEGLALFEEVYRVPKRPASLQWVGEEVLDCYVKADKKQEALTLAKELLAQARSQQPKSSPELAGNLSFLGLSLLQLKAYAEAEPLLRECLAIRQAKVSDNWRTFNARSMLGGTLLGLKKYTEAEPLLLSGYEGMKQREKTIEQVGKTRIPEALERLVQFYEVMGKEDDAARWRKELELTKAAQKKTEKHP